MAKEEKKYSLISLDTETSEEDAGVRTTRRVVDGEETVVVSSRPYATGGDAKEVSATHPAAPSSTAEAEPASSPARANEEHGQDGADEVPFKRMQTVIIVALVVVIVVFFVYFNFLR